MSEESTRRDAPLWRRPYLLATLVLGLGFVVAGGVAVFVTDNELGSASLVAAGVAVAGFGVFGDRVRSVEAGWRQARPRAAGGAGLRRRGPGPCDR